MKYISTILSIIALGLIAVLWTRQSRQLDQMNRHVEGEKKTSGSGFKVAYFDMDTLQAYYSYFKDAQAQLKTKENAMNMELNKLNRDNQKKIESWRQKGNTMTQAEGEQAQQEYQQMQQEFASRKQSLENELYQQSQDLKTNIRQKIEDFLREYNKQRNFSYIIEYEPGSFVYAKDTVYNITNDLLEGLNSTYKKNK